MADRGRIGHCLGTEPRGRGPGETMTRSMRAAVGAVLAVALFGADVAHANDEIDVGDCDITQVRPDGTVLVDCRDALKPADDLPYTMRYYPEMPIPAGYRVVQRKQRGLTIAGAVTLGSVYFWNTFAAGMELDGGGEYTPLFVPIAGPFLAMTTIEDLTGPGAYLLVMDGLVQAGALTMLIAGLTTHKKVLVRDVPVSMSVGPTWSGDGAMVGISGRI